MRGWLTWLHRWLGLALSAVVGVLALTGSLLVFYPEIDLWLHPQWQAAATGGDHAGRHRPAPDALPVPGVVQQQWQALRAHHPDRVGSWRIEMPLQPGWPAQARYMKPAETQGREFAPLMVMLAPDRGEVLAERFWGQYLVTWLYDLHYTLLLDRAGRTVLAILGLATVPLMGVGLCLWWRARRPGRALQVRWRGRAQQWVYDLHGVLGALVLPVWLLLVGTGVMLAEPDWFKPLLQRVSSVQPAPSFHAPDFEVGQATMTADTVIARAQAQFPGAELRWVETPGRGMPVWRVRLWQPDEPGRRFPRSLVWVHAQTGEVLAVRDPARHSGAESVLAWLHPLHSGEALGLVGRVAVLLAGVAWLLSVGTGLMRWWHKRRGRLHRSRVDLSP
ncbi:PepSY domain-containing protein [Aquabacterium lacunae]|uniref:PepSY domain-containing protein n=1 Tax=Aquabacterium lacunae TaxID=2528630 RepID=A0A4Q9H0G0_9BURK|nr:PepSY-associated TM helix domain-containing protein [Aquabacterium lacunae]TBO32763.1 PepSY domain-containing protein [Aquabacterium lacunae]